MALIVGHGGPTDPGALKLETRKQNWIYNAPSRERSPEEMQAALVFAKKDRPDVLLRSLASHYNCMGMIFGSRRTTIDVDQWDLIRRDDQYRRLGEGESPVIGDLIVYRVNGTVEHVGKVVEVRLAKGGGPLVRILSQWGHDGEYLHPVDQVPPLFGQTTEYWTERGAK